MAFIQPIPYVHGQSSYRWFEPVLPEYDKPIQSQANQEPRTKKNWWEEKIRKIGKRDRRKMKSLQSKRLGIS